MIFRAFKKMLACLAVSGLSCGTRGLLLQFKDSLVVVRGLSSPETCGVLVPHRGSNLCPLHCKADS